MVRLHQKRVTLAATDADRVALLTGAASIWEQELDRPDEALQAVRDAVRIDPRDPTLIDSLERLADASNGWAAVDGLVDDIAAHGDLDRRALYELRLRSAGWYRDRLGDLRKAERALTDALELDPEPLEAHRERVEIIREGDRATELVSGLRAWADVEPNLEERRGLLREAAELAQHDLGDPELAAECHQELLAIDANDADALRALCAVRRGQSRWNEVVGLLERQLEASLADDGAAVAQELGQVYRDHLDDPRAATRAYERAHELAPNDAATMDSLEALYRDHDRIESLRTLLERRVDRASGPERTSLQLRLAELYERSFRDQAAAIATYRQVLGEAPDNAPARADLQRLLEATGAWDDLVDALSTEADRLPEDEKRERLGRIAEIHQHQRRDLDAAIETYERIQADLGADPGSLRALVSLYEQKGSWRNVADTLEQLAAQLDGQEAVDASHRVADLWEQQLGDAEQAGRALRGAYERFPRDASIRERLKAYYASIGEHRALAAVLDAELELAQTDGERAGLLRSISDVYRDHLDDPATAASYLERAVELDTDDRAALVPLCELYVAAGRQADAVPILRRIIESYGRKRSKELATHHHRLGRALAAMGDSEGALASYDAAFKIDLTNVSILRDLGRLTHERGDLDRAQKSFRALLLQKLEPDSGIQKADVYFYLGDIASKQGDARKAVQMLERALAEDRGHAQASELLGKLKG